MRTGLAGNLTLAALVGALALLAYWYPRGEVPADFAITALKPEAANRIRVERTGALPIVLERVHGAWFLTAPLKARADASLVQRLLGIVEARGSHRLEATDLERFALERPQARLTINDQSFSFGLVSPVAREQYVLTGDAVYMVNPRYGTALPASAQELISRHLFAPGEAPVRIEIGKLTVAQSAGKWVAAPAQADLSQDDLVRWVDGWRRAMALRVAPLGREKAAGEIRVELENGTRLTLGILARTPELVIARPDERLQYHFLAESAQRLLAPPGAARNGHAAQR